MQFRIYSERDVSPFSEKMEKVSCKLSHDIDVIIVGAGFGGLSAAIKLARANKKVIVLERGMPVGSKNLSGGVLWGNDLGEILPNWKEEAPIERFVVKKKLGFLSEGDATILDFYFDDFKEKKTGAIVLRAKFDAWLAEQAKEAGARVEPGINVDKLLVENGQVVGIESNGETLRAPITIIMDGANSRLTLESGFRNHSKMSEAKGNFMLGIKEVLSLDPELINQRFGVSSEHGSAGEYVLGNMPNDVLAGGFIYTNGSSISLGVVIHLTSLSTKDRSYEVYEKFKSHPHVQQLIEGASQLEYGAHLIPEAGIKMMPQISGPGFLVGGDAAGFVFSNGMVIQGMNYAAKSGILAAEAAIAALDKGSFDAKTMGQYDKMIKDSYIYKDLKNFKNVTKMTKNPNLFKIYPEAINNGFKNLIEEDGKPKQKAWKTIMKSFKEKGAGLFTLMRDGRKGMNL